MTPSRTESAVVAKSLCDRHPGPQGLGDDRHEAAQGHGARRVLSTAITTRAIIIGLALIPFNAWWLAQVEWVRYSDNATTSALFFHTIAQLLLLLALNAALTRFAPRWAFSRAELLVIYVMITTASVLAGHDQLQILMSTLAVVIGRATPENQWGILVHPYLPRHLVVGDSPCPAYLAEFTPSAVEGLGT
jgi:hypothetical protein